jgi:cytochrome P450
MAGEAREISWWDCARLQLLLTVPTSLRGLAVPNPVFVGLLCKLNAGQWTARILSELRRKYGSDHLWAWFPFGRTLLVLDRESIECVLRSEKNQADPFLKKYVLSRFVPEGVIISSGSEWQERRGFNESVLHFGHLHRHAEAIKEIVFREGDQMAGYLVGTLRWADFQRLAERISHQVILGSGQVNPGLAQRLDRMVNLSNWFLRSSRFPGFYEEIERYLSRERSSLHRSGTGSEGNAAGCLMRDSAAELEAGRASAATQVPSQIGFWFTVLKDAVELHVARTAALIAVHPEVQDRVRAETLNAARMTAQAIDGLQYLGACIGEQLRLWTPVPVLLRRVVEPFGLPQGTTVEAGQQILMHTGFYHRDPAVFRELADRFAPDAVDGNFPPVYFFSGHRQSCAGEFVARFVLKATLAALLARFRFELVAPGIDTSRIPYLYNHLDIEVRAIRDA